MDIRLYTRSGNYPEDNLVTEEVDSALVNTTVTSRQETIAGKVVKFLLTTKGSDVLDNTYGSYLPTYTQISEAYLPKFNLEVYSDVRNCESHIRASEAELDSSVEKLSRISIKDIVYNRLIPNRVDIYLEVITTFNNSVILSVNT